MKIKLEEGKYSVEIEIKDEYLDQRYKNDEDYVRDQFRAHFHSVLGNLYCGDRLQAVLNSLEQSFAEQRLRIIQNVKSSLDNIVDPTKTN